MWSAIQASDQRDNITDSYAAADAYLIDPTGAPGGTLDLYPEVGALQAAAIDLSQFAGFPDHDKDFNGDPRDGTYRGAYAGEGTNPGWQLQFDNRPLSGNSGGSSGGGSGGSGGGSSNTTPVADADAD